MFAKRMIPFLLVLSLISCTKVANVQKPSEKTASTTATEVLSDALRFLSSLIKDSDALVLAEKVLASTNDVLSEKDTEELNKLVGNGRIKGLIKSVSLKEGLWSVDFRVDSLERMPVDDSEIEKLLAQSQTITLKNFLEEHQIDFTVFIPQDHPEYLFPNLAEGAEEDLIGVPAEVTLQGAFVTEPQVSSKNPGSFFRFFQNLLIPEAHAASKKKGNALPGPSYPNYTCSIMAGGTLFGSSMPTCSDDTGPISCTRPYHQTCTCCEKGWNCSSTGSGCGTNDCPRGQQLYSQGSTYPKLCCNKDTEVACGSGYSRACVSKCKNIQGGYLDTNSCECTCKIPGQIIEKEAAPALGGGTCVCPNGQHVINGACASCTANSKWNDSLGACQCEVGYVPVGTQCLKCPGFSTSGPNGLCVCRTGEHWDASANPPQCVCDYAGQTRVGEYCQCPAGEKLYGTAPNRYCGVKYACESFPCTGQNEVCNEIGDGKTAPPTRSCDCKDGYSPNPTTQVCEPNPVVPPIAVPGCVICDNSTQCQAGEVCIDNDYGKTVCVKPGETTLSIHIRCGGV